MEDLMVPPLAPGGRPDALVGQIVGGKFRIIRPLGAGGMGTVYLAVQEDVAREVVVKVMLSGLAKDPTALERFKREARSLGQIDHRNVVRVHDFGPHGDTYFLAMEYVKGYDLSTLLKQGRPIEASRALHIAGQVLGALHVAHGHGIIHRDLKPGNIRITAGPNDTDFVKVLDFGLVKSHSDVVGSAPLTQVGRVVGTPAYMSPEQVVGGEVDARSDIYSVGVILYQMVTGSHPFTASTPTGFMRRHYHDRPEGPSERVGNQFIHPELEAYVMRLLSKKPGDRPGSAREALNELKRVEVLVGGPVVGAATEEAVRLPVSPSPKAEPVAKGALRPADAGAAGERGHPDRLPHGKVTKIPPARQATWIWWLVLGLAGLGGFVLLLLWAFPAKP